MSVNGNNGAIDIGNVFFNPPNQCPEFAGGGVSHGVGNVDGGGPGGDRRFEDLVQKFGIGASRIFWGEFHIIDEGFGVGDHFRYDRQDFFSGFAEFVL